MELSTVLVEQGQVGQAPHNSIAADPISTLRGCFTYPTCTNYFGHKLSDGTSLVMPKFIAVR